MLLFIGVAKNERKDTCNINLTCYVITGCTTETYGLTQSDFRQVDKEFKADKMIKLPEGFGKANDMIIDVLSTWQPIFDEIDKDLPDAKRKAEKKVERNLNDDTEGEFRIYKLNPKKVSG
ncbi:MAG: hypothetical protein LBV11_20240 [Bacillus cereus]|nr:hypothetical protein [Bacillus cereus]MDR2996102.1 hypothetical protein [Bacillus cereus]